MQLQLLQGKTSLYNRNVAPRHLLAQTSSFQEIELMQYVPTVVSRVQQLCICRFLDQASVPAEAIEGRSLYHVLCGSHGIRWGNRPGIHLHVTASIHHFV